jgi:N-acetylmuramoyl-L-alanine amidase
MGSAQRRKETTIAMNIVISSGHGKYIRGASGYLDEVDEARRVVACVAEYLRAIDVGCLTFNDDVSTTQSENLQRIVAFHNSQQRDLDVSVHFNAYDTTDEPMGCEVLYQTQQDLAQSVADSICSAAALKNRGAKKRTDLFFLNKTNEAAILIEVCFVDSSSDAMLYKLHFERICLAICNVLSGVQQKPETGLTPLLTIGSVVIYTNEDGSYVRFISDLDICNDGSGPSHGDPHHQSATAYYNGGKYLNADVDKYIVIPPQVRSMVEGKVMGCKAILTNLDSELPQDAVTGEIGPDDKTGEAAYCLAKIVNPNITHNSGDKSLIYLYELWPDVPAVVDDKTYKLE